MRTDSQGKNRNPTRSRTTREERDITMDENRVNLPLYPKNEVAVIRREGEGICRERGPASPTGGSYLSDGGEE